MNGVLEAALDLQGFLLKQAWRFWFIGGLAVQKWSEPRVIDDADVTIFTGFGSEERYLDTLLGWLEPRRADAREFALRARVFLGRTPSGVPVGYRRWGRFRLRRWRSRARDVELSPNCWLRLCTAEDLIVFNAFAARPLDWRDVEMTIVRQGDAGLDWVYSEEQLRPLAELKNDPEVLPVLRALRERLRG
ncbi:MAG: hypothetical protein ACR2NX_09810 [Chthoniobacterales bacterium]